MSKDILFFKGEAFRKRDLDKNSPQLDSSVYVVMFDYHRNIQTIVEAKVVELDPSDIIRPVRIQVSTEVANENPNIRDLFIQTDGGFARWAYANHPTNEILPDGFVMIVERAYGVNEAFIQINGQKFEFDYTPENAEILSKIVDESLPPVTPELPEITVNGKTVDASKISPELLEALRDLPEISLSAEI